MRKTVYILLAALPVVMAVPATAGVQGPAGRTATTIVADVLAQMPAGNGESFAARMNDLASTGEAGVLQLADMMNPAGHGSNARVEYALSGLSHWVSIRGNEAQRLATSDAYIKALGLATDRDVKAFIILQLQLIGRDEAVAPLTALLSDDSLKEPARAALASITGNAAPVLSRADSRTAALAGKMSAAPAKATNLLKKALRDADRRYRFAALEMASPYADQAMYATLVGSLANAKPGVATDVLNWLSEESDLPGRGAVIAPVAGEAAIGLLTGGDADQTRAAAGLLNRIGGAKSIDALASLLGSTDPAMVGIAGDALASTGGDVASAVAPFVAAGSDAGKAAALSLLAGRRSTANSALVFGQLTSASQVVRTAAYAALKDVVSAADLPRLWPLLEGATAQNAAPVRQAVTEAMHALPAAERYTAVLDRMNAAPASRQYLYYQVLASTGDRRALALIIERFDEGSGTAKDAAFDALLRWNGINAANKLLAITKDPALGDYFDRAIDRITTLASEQSVDGETGRSLLVEALGLARTDQVRRTILTRIGATDSYPGMVKAGEYLDHPVGNVRQAAATAVMTIALANPEFTGVQVRDLLDKVIEVIDNADADYQRQAMRKHLDEMVDAEPFVLPEDEKKEGFTVLFDGTDLDAWTGNKTDYRVQSGTISLYPSRSFGGNLYTAKEYGNFVFRFEFMLTPGANNGVGIRAEQGKDAAYYGMEIQILDHDDPIYRDITPLQVHGSVYGVIGAKRAVLKPGGEWNVEEIYANGDHIRVTLNGEVIVDGNIRQAASGGGTADGKEHPGLFNKKGYIGFLGHGSQLKFRNIRIQELP